MSSRIKGFTLIELLVVISIIAILSSIVLAAASGARSKAKVAAGQEFADNIRSALYDANPSTQYSYSFNECAGTTASDDLGSINGLSLGSLESWSTVTPAGSGCSIYFNDSGGGDPTSAMKFAVPITPPVTSSGGGYAVAFWIKTSIGSSVTDVIFSNRQGGSLTFEVANGYPNIYAGWNVALSRPLINDNQWHYVTWSIQWTSGAAAAFSLYVDGSLIGKVSGGAAVNHSTASYLGYDPGNTGRHFTGYLDDFRIYDQALSFNQIHGLYLAGAAKHGIALND